MNCKVCNSSNNNLIQHKVYKCNECNHTFINYTDDGILYHKELYRKPGQDGTRGNNEVQDGKFTQEFHNRRKTICEKRINKTKEYLLECDSLLDIGAGGGTFLNMAKNYVLEYEATEVSDLCASNLTEYGYKVHHGAFTKMDINRSFDLVTCWHVLEHVEDLPSFLDKAVKVTDKYLIIEVPTNRRLRNPDVNFDGHFHYFSKESISLLFEKHFNFLYLGEGIQNPALLCILQKK